MKSKDIIYIILIIVILILFGGELYLFKENQNNKKLIEGLEKTNLKLESELENKGTELYKIQEKLYNNPEKNNSAENTSNTDDESIFENTSTEGLSSISESDAKIIWEEYKEKVLLDNLNRLKFKEVKIEKVKPTNYFTSGSASNIKTADFEREAYVFYYGTEDDLEQVVGYVDLYTGKVIGGYYSGV